MTWQIHTSLFTEPLERLCAVSSNLLALINCRAIVLMISRFVCWNANKGIYWWLLKRKRIADKVSGGRGATTQ